MNWKRIGLGALVAVAALGGTAYVFRKPIILYFVATRGLEAIAPHREVVWEKGPDVAAKPVSERPPNIVVILADDLGINDISTFGGGVAGGLVATPNIDSIAKDGAAFVKAYSGTAACAPSRAMLMTGRYGTRTGFEFTPTPDGMGGMLDLFYNDGTRPHELLRTEIATDKKVPFKDQGLPSSEITLAEVLKPAGYHTMHIGKWHLGQSKQFAPNAQGFDESINLEGLLHLP